MGVITSLIAFSHVAKVASDKLNVDPKDVKTASELFKSAKSISAAASRYILDYPVAVSESVTSYATGIAIAKQIEVNCARYVVLMCGLNPVIDTRKGDTISAHLSSLTTSFESLTGQKVNFSLADRETTESLEDYFRENYSTEEYIPFKEKTAFIHSHEMKEGPNGMGDKSEKEPAFDGIVTDPDALYDRDWLESLDNEDRINFKNYLEENNYNWDTMKNDKGMKQKIYANYKNVISEDYKPTMKPDEIQKLDKLGPTIINIQFILDSDGGQKTINIPVAVKASLQFLQRGDVKQLLKNVESGSSKFQNFIKVKTGQINFFKDVLFQLDEAKHDIEREKELGRIPFYRNLMDSKNKYRFKNLFSLIPKLKDFVAKKTQKDMPMCTVAITSEELVEASGRKLTYLIQNRKFINSMIDTYMLLCLCVFDETQNIVYFFFSGEDQPQIQELDKIGKVAVGGNGDSSTNAAMLNLTKWMMRH